MPENVAWAPAGAVTLPFTVPGLTQWLWHIALVIAGFLRFSVFGAYYLVVYFIASLVSVKKQGRVRHMLVYTTLAVATVATLLQTAMQIAWAIDDTLFPPDTMAYNVLKVIGVQQITSGLEGFRIITPDPLVLVASIAAWYFWLRDKSISGAPNSPPAVIPAESDEPSSPLIQRLQQDDEAAKAEAVDVLFRTPAKSPEHHRRRDRLFWLRMAEFLLIVGGIALAFSALAAPSVISLPYLLIVLLTLWLWTLQWRVPVKAQSRVQAGLVIYALFHLSLVYIYQFAPVSSVFPQNVAAWLGLFSFYSTGADWVAPLWTTYMLMPSLLFVIVCLRGFQRCQASADALRKKPDSPQGPEFPSTKRRSVVWAPIIRSPQSYLLYTFMLAPPILMAWAITFPNYITAIFMIWSLAAVLFPTSKRLLMIFHRPLLLIALADVLLSTLANLNGPPPKDFPYTGWEVFSNPFMSIGGQLLFTLGFCFTVYPIYIRSNTRDRRGSIASSLGSPMLSPTLADNIEEPVDEAAEKRKADWASFVHTLRVMGGLLFIYILEHLYILALAVVYFCSLESVNIFNALFLLFFLAFLLSPSFAQRGWIGLVVYTEIVILVQFVWQFQWSDDIPDDNPIVKLIGLENYYEDLWSGLALHITILFATWLQLATYNYLEERKRLLTSSLESLNVQTRNTPADAIPDSGAAEDAPLLSVVGDQPGSQPEESSAHVEAEDIPKDPWHMRFLNIVLFLYELTTSIVNENLILLCFLQFLLIGLTGQANLIEISYLVFLFVCLVFYQLHLPKLVIIIWPVVVFASASFLTSCYLYQFEGVKDWLLRYGDVTFWEDMGLITSPPPQLFLYLLQHVAIFISTGIQLLLFVTSSNQTVKSLWGEEGYVATSFPGWLKNLVLVTQRLFILGAPRSVLILLFVSAIKTISVINGVFLVLLAVYAPWRRLQRWTRLVVLIWTEIMVTSLLIFQFNTIQEMLTEEQRDNLTYIGYILLPSSATLTPEIALVLMVSISTAALDWRRAICEETLESMTQLPNGALEYDPEGTFLVFRATSASAKDNIATTSLRRLPTASEVSKRSSSSTTGVALASVAPSDVENIASHDASTKTLFPGSIDGSGMDVQATIANTPQPTELPLLDSFKDLLANVITYGGFQLAQLMHVIAALVRLNVIGLFYITMLGFTLILPKRIAARVWWIYLGVLAVILCWQYFVNLGLPPSASSTLPWDNLSPSLRQVLGLDLAEPISVLFADFFLLFMCILQRDVFYRESHLSQRRTHEPSIEQDEHYIEPTLFDFTKPPRSFLSEIKLTYFRYFFKLVIILTFIGGTSAVSVLSFFYLLLSMYMLSKGEDVLLNKTVRTRVWFVYRWYNYMWFVTIIAFQIPAYLNDFTGNEILSIIGLNRLVLQQDELTSSFDQLSFSKQRIVSLLAFAAMLIQQSIYDSPYFHLLLRYMHEELRTASERQAAYKSKQLEEQERKRNEIKANFLRSKAKYDSMIKKFYSRWSGVTFGQTTAASTGPAATAVDIEDPSNSTDLIGTEGPTTATETSDVVSTPTNSSKPFENVAPISAHELETARQQEQLAKQTMSSFGTDVTEAEMKVAENTPFIAEEPMYDPNEVMDHSSWMNRTDHFIYKLYALSADYAVIDDVTMVDPQELRTSDSWNHRVWLIIFGIYYALIARVDLLVYIFIFVNQIVNGTIMSTILTWALLLFGIASHPFSPRAFWTFVIIYVECVIILKYFFQFPFNFNDPYTLDPDTACTDDAAFVFNFVTIFGIQRYCDKFFSPHIITEMLTLVSAFSLRTVLQKFGLWDSSTLELTEEQQAYMEKKKSNNTNKERSITALTVVPTSGSVNSSDEDNEPLPASTSSRPQVVISLEAEECDDVHDANDLIEEEEEVKPSSGFDPASPFRVVGHKIVAMVDSLTGATETSLGDDFYTVMFFADALVFVLTVLFFKDFSTDTGSDLSNILEQNQVPLLFLVIAITEFVLILVDRMIYSAKAIRVKILMQYGTVIGYHVWLFFYIPGAKGEPFIDTGILPVWYFVKCIYWYYSALQLKSGYLKFNVNLFFLTRSYGTINRFLYIGYRQIPFVFEIRCLLDWTVADTTLNFFRWLKFEDIYASNYDIKTFREAQKRNDRQVGDIQPKLAQWCMGICFAILLVLLLWFPLLLMALPGATVPNPPVLMDFEMTINDFDAIYIQSTSPNEIQSLTQAQYDALLLDYRSVFSRVVPLSSYQTIVLRESSRVHWGISPPARTALVSDLRNPNITSFVKTYFMLERTNQVYSQAHGSFTRDLTDEEAQSLADVLESAGSLELSGLIPMFIESQASGDVVNLDISNSPDTLMTVQLTHTYDNVTDQQFAVEWFDAVMMDGDTGAAEQLNFVVLSNNVPSSSSVGSYGIIGLYVVVVYTVGSLIRVMISNSVSKIMFEDLPSVDRILDMCHDVYVAREFKGFVMEEELYSELIELYRDPQALIEISKMKDE